MGGVVVGGEVWGEVLGSRQVQGWVGSGWCRIRLGSNSFIIVIFSISLSEIISFHNFYRLGYIRLGYVSCGVSTGPASYYIMILYWKSCI